MKLLKLSLMTIVICHMALLSRSQELLETGYEYGENENPTIADRYRDLKCTYLFAGLTHMRLMKLMLEDKFNSPAISVSLVPYYNSRAVICTLYGVIKVDIGSLWLLHLYSIVVKFHYDDYISNINTVFDRLLVFAKLVDVTDYVASRVQKELSDGDCRPGNRFDTYEKWYALMAAAKPSGRPDLRDMQREVLNNCSELDSLLDTNDAQSTYGRRYEALQPNPLLLNILPFNKPIKTMLITAYNVHISWHRVNIALKRTWLYLYKHMFYKKIGLLNIKRYYGAQFSLFKGIMYRLTWKHLLYIKTFTGCSRVDYLKKWHDLLSDFQKFLCLHDDPDVVELLVAIDRLSRNDESIVNIIYQLQDKLYTINNHLQCIATDPMPLEPGQLPSNVDQNTPSQVANECKSLEEAQSYIDYLKVAFQNVDFNIVRSLVTYIDDRTKW